MAHLLTCLVALGMLGGLLHAQNLVQNRIAQAIRSDQMHVLRGTVHPGVAAAHDQGELNGSTMIQDMSFSIRRSAAQEADLENLLEQQQTKGSPLYHRWLTPSQFHARYGVSQQDLAKITAWLQSEGFKIEPAAGNADHIRFSGTAAQVNSVFQTDMHRYLLHGQTFWANSVNISVPEDIAGMTIGIRHLNSFRPYPHFNRRPIKVSSSSSVNAPHPNYSVGGGQYFIAPSDIATIYDVNGLYNSSITGSGQTIAVTGQTDITKYQSDIKTFRTLSGLNASNLPKQIVVPGTGNVTVSAKDLTEADIDVEWSGAVAKDASILYVTTGSNGNVFDSLLYAIETPLVNNTQAVPVISISYGSCEQPGSQAPAEYQQIEQVLEEANAQGQTIVAASGDEGSADCDYNTTSGGAVNGLAVDYPGSSQYVTSAGGSSFSGDIGDASKYWSANNNADNGSALGYIPETTWNNTPTLSALNQAGQLSAGGGGASVLFSKPSWQVAPGVPSDGKRDVPDISLASDPAHDGYVLCTEEPGSGGALSPTCTSNGYFSPSGGYVYGGTSIAAPQFAAMITLWNQKSGNTAGVGNVNPILYLSASNTPGAFHDITTGSNAVVCKAGSPNCVNGVMSCCSAGTGYDQATGLGSVDAASVAAIWPMLPAVNGNFSLLLDNPAISVDPGSSQSTKVVLTPSGAGGDSEPGFSGTVNLTCSNLPAGVSCSFSPGSSVTLSPGTAQTVTLTLTATTSAAATTTAHQSSQTPLRRGWPIQTAFAGVLGLSLLGVGRKRRVFAARWMAVLLLFGGLIATTALTACGGGSSNSSSGSGSSGTGNNNNGTPVTQTITVTGTSGSTTASAQIQLTVT